MSFAQLQPAFKIQGGDVNIEQEEALNIDNILLSLHSNISKTRGQIHYLSKQSPNDAGTHVTDLLLSTRNLLNQAKAAIKEWDLATSKLSLVNDRRSRDQILSSQFRALLNTEITRYEELVEFSQSFCASTISTSLEDQDLPLSTAEKNLSNQFNRDQPMQFGQTCHSTYPQKVGLIDNTSMSKASTFDVAHQFEIDSHAKSMYPNGDSPLSIKLAANGNESPVKLDGNGSNMFYPNKNKKLAAPVSHDWNYHNSTKTSSTECSATELIYHNEQTISRNEDSVFSDRTTNTFEETANKSHSNQVSSTMQTASYDQSSSQKFTFMDDCAKFGPSNPHVTRNTSSQSTIATNTQISMAQVDKSSCHLNITDSDDDFIKNDYSFDDDSQDIDDDLDNNDDVDDEFIKLLHNPAARTSPYLEGWQHKSKIRQKQQTSSLQSYISAERFLGMQNIRHQAHQLFQVFQDFNNLISHQQKDLDVFDETLIHIGGDTMHAVDELRRANQKRQTLRRRQLICASSTIGLFILLYFIINLPQLALSSFRWR